MWTLQQFLLNLKKWGNQWFSRVKAGDKWDPILPSVMLMVTQGFKNTEYLVSKCIDYSNNYNTLQSS